MNTDRSARARIEAALERAKSDAKTRQVNTARDGHPRKRQLAIGDAQGPITKLMEILERHRALDDEGRLDPNVELISIGDHFDFGGRELRERSGTDGLEILSWLAAHPADQVTIILGNHDLARVTELASFDDASFAVARQQAELAYRDGDVDRDREEEFLAKYPQVATAEVIARDYSSFSLAQRELVRDVLVLGRMRFARAIDRDLLFLHAGITKDDLRVFQVSEKDAGDAYFVESFLGDRLAGALEVWAKNGGALDLEPLHLAGNAKIGESRGVLQHRPANPSSGKPEMFDGPPRRRFDPRTLPRGLTQVIGHIRDNKCRALLGSWAVKEPVKDGPLRSLATDGSSVTYRRGLVPAERDVATIYFVDGGLNYAPADDYELLDVIDRRPASFGP